MVIVSCHVCNGIHQLPVSAARVRAWQQSRTLIQDAFPELTADQRELLQSQTCSRCWDKLFPPEEE